MNNNAIECSVFSRVTGYITEVNRWNKGKAQEFKSRKTYDSAL